MIKSRYNVIGVMSGTSLDGIDLAYLTFECNKKWTFEILNAVTIPYSQFWLEKLSNLIYLNLNDLKQIDVEYTVYLSNVINSFIDEYKIKDIDAICSHGHTALHQPKKGFTYQIGNQKKIAELTQHKVVCDFRVQDVAFGGQGAPLVPIGDQLLFSDYKYCLNLGGFANVSFEDNNNRIAFDICPVNIVLNHYSKILDLEYDANGNIASEGKVDSLLLAKLNALEFYKLDFPKSLGLEWVNLNIIPIIDSHQLEVKDILRTVVEHIAVQISSVLNKQTTASVLISGGGVYNTFLIERLKAFCKNEIVIPSKLIIEYKEALIFGLLGVLKLRGETNCLASVTGASHDHSSGTIYTI